MKVGTATTILFATLALASPAPLARPEPAPVAQLMEVESRDQPSANLVARLSSFVPEIYARAAGGRKKWSSSGKSSSSGGKSSSSSSKPKAPKGGSGNKTESAAISVTPSHALQLGVIGLVAVEVAIQWS